MPAHIYPILSINLPESKWGHRFVCNKVAFLDLCFGHPQGWLGLRYMSIQWLPLLYPLWVFTCAPTYMYAIRKRANKHHMQIHVEL